MNDFEKGLRNWRRFIFEQNKGKPFWQRLQEICLKRFAKCHDESQRQAIYEEELVKFSGSGSSTVCRLCFQQVGVGEEITHKCFN